MLLILGANGGIGRGLLDCAISSGAYGRVRGVYRADCDVTSEDSISEFFNPFVESDNADPIHVINATGFLMSNKIGNVGSNELDHTIMVNLRGSYIIAQEFALAAENRPGSSLLLLSSVVSRLGVYGASAYGMSKAGISGLVRSAAKEFARFDARINSIEMGYFDVGMIDAIPPPIREKIVESIPQKRLGTVEELWELCDVMLTNTYMTGSTVTLSGGL